MSSVSHFAIDEDSNVLEYQRFSRTQTVKSYRLVLCFFEFVFSKCYTTANMNYKDRIVKDPNILVGKPTIKGTRISVELLLKKLAQNISPEEILEDYPNLNRADIQAAILYAEELVKEQVPAQSK